MNEKQLSAPIGRKTGGVLRLWGYYALHSFWNSLRKIFRSTFVVVIVCCALFGGVIGFSVSFLGETFFPEDTQTEENTEDGYYEEEGKFVPYEDGYYDEDGNWVAEDEDGIGFDTENMTEQDIYLIKLGVEAGVAALLLTFLLIGIYSGAKKGSDIFLMADVNLLFTAPMKPQTVLLFRLSFQMMTSLLASIYLLFQIPNLVINLHLGVYSVVAIIMAWILLLFMQKLMSVFTYTLTSTHVKMKQYVLPFVLLVAAAALLGTGALFLANGRDIWLTLEAYGNNWTRFVPIIGWYKAMIMTAVEGQMSASFIYMALLLVSMAFLAWGIWRMRADFYEDAMAGATAREELMAAAREGRKTNQKERSEKIKRNSEMKGFGANVFLHKELYNRKRFSKLGFLTNTMLIYLAVAVLIPVFSEKVLEIQCDFMAIGIITAGILFFRNYGNPIARETSMNWLFLAPDSPYKKVFFAMASGSCSCALDMLPAMVLGGVLTKADPLMWLFWYVTLVLMDFMLSAVGIFLEAMFPATAMDVVKAMLQMMLKVFVLLILVILLAAGYLFGGIGLGLLLINLCSVALGAVGFIFYPAMLHNGIE